MNFIYRKYIIFLLLFGMTHDHQIHTMETEKKITCIFNNNEELFFTTTLLNTSATLKDATANPSSKNGSINLTMPDIIYKNFKLIVPIMESISLNKKLPKKNLLWPDKKENDLLQILKTVDYLDIPALQKKLTSKIAQLYDVNTKSSIGTPNFKETQQQQLENLETTLHNNNLYNLICNKMKTVSDSPTIHTITRTDSTQFSPKKNFKLNCIDNKIDIIQCSNNKTIHTIENYTKTDYEKLIFSPDEKYLLYCKKENSSNAIIFPKKERRYDTQFYGWNCTLVNLTNNTSVVIDNIIWASNNTISKTFYDSTQIDLLCSFNPTTEYMLINTYNKSNEKLYEIRELSSQKTILTLQQTTTTETIEKIEFHSTNKLIITKKNNSTTTFSLSIIDLSSPQLNRDIPLNGRYQDSIKINHNKQNNNFLIYTEDTDAKIFLYDEKSNILTEITPPPSLTKHMFLDFNNKKNIFLISGTNAQNEIEAFLYNYDNNNYDENQTYTKIFTLDKPRTDYGCNCQIDSSGKYIAYGNSSAYYAESSFGFFDIQNKKFIKLLDKQEGLIRLHPTQPIVFIIQRPKNNESSIDRLILYDLALQQQIGTYPIPMYFRPISHLSKNGKLLLLPTQQKAPSLKVGNNISLVSNEKNQLLINVATGEEINYDDLATDMSIETINWNDNNDLLVIKKDHQSPDNSSVLQKTKDIFNDLDYENILTQKKEQPSIDRQRPDNSSVPQKIDKPFEYKNYFLHIGATTIAAFIIAYICYPEFFKKIIIFALHSKSTVLKKGAF